MTRLRYEKTQKAANDIPDLEILGDKDADLLLVGWGSTLGSLRAAMEVVQSSWQESCNDKYKIFKPFA